MEGANTNNKNIMLNDPATPYMRVFASQEEAELYNLRQYLHLSDTDKFNLFCDMLRLEQLYKKAKISDYKEFK